MSALICGSIAYDNIMVFQSRFQDQILPDQIHVLNVSFLVPALRREFGGCAANIAYNLGLLGETGYPMATVGHDFAPYREWLGARGVPLDFVRELRDSWTAVAYITTDLADNQITAFHPGAMQHAHINAVPAHAGIRWGMVSPDGRQGMIDHAEQFAAAGIPFIFDPGQGLPMFGAAELTRFIELADVVAVNDYEGKMLSQRTGLDDEQIAARVQAYIVTRGAEGSTIMAGGRRHDIPAAAPEAVVDPTGCGDAYRAGLLFGLLRGADWETTGRIAALMGALKVESAGTQNHHFAREAFDERFSASFGYEHGLSG
ncbi:carbohydrate kinase family protein [Thioalkalivibrio sp. XN279]|uniref:carbohydrate kinase family protein n=1 Tax=Thioalkalivibrio sp. XN279 TaxID=2714953 RepID=UPI001408AA6E|nr:carbohydrate kinase family protein [Thioalkalivibrio sp. XN279]NHA15127.1 carbohydrate kinase family protein [Thioalkalivibrio sp. XN279]